MSRIDDRPVALNGFWGEVRFFRRPNQETLAKAYYDALSVAEQAQLIVQFRKIANDGRLHDSTKYNHLQDDIYEFKTKRHRITTIQCKRTWFLLHGFPKRGRKTPKTELAMARKLKAELDEFLNAGGREACRAQ